MKAIDSMTQRERQGIIQTLELEHRVAITEAARIKRTMRQLAAELESKERRIGEIETGIALLR
ncbi:hypothetical protein SEA_ZIMMER_34 [Mycobacterium phage Zimmer]|nr:hypothetical protein SEA_ZIMMER_34 [Mycobacterium phage Zimmer]